MQFRKNAKRYILVVFTQLVFVVLFGQPGVPATKWTAEGSSYYIIEKREIVKIDLPSQNKIVFIGRERLITKNGDTLNPRSFLLSPDGKLALIYTNAQKVWRYQTRGDYWLLNLASGQLKQMGKGRPAATLQFAKFSPDSKKVGYVSERNIYVEDLATGSIKKLTSDNGTRKLINGTFDWVYEEEFSCRDGFRWSPDSKSIAYWQIDANKIRDYYMLNTTDSVYSQVIPVEYPKVGEPPSPARIGVVSITSGQTKWLKVPGEPDQHYLIRMEYSPAGEIIMQQLNRKQNESRLLLCNAMTGDAKIIYTESDKAWVSTINEWRSEVKGWDWISNGNEFLWVSEKDGWRHLYRISKDGKKETLITKGNYDVIDMLNVDEKNGLVYFYASPTNATQKFLYFAKIDGNYPAERVSPPGQEGTHTYEISPNGKFARHAFSNYYTPPATEWVTLPDHKPFKEADDISKKIKKENREKSNVSFFQVKTEEGVVMDGWKVLPKNFDSTKKYPVVFYVYGEPAGATVTDAYDEDRNFLYPQMDEDGYIQVSLDNRGTPAPRGREWRKSIYKKIGQLNIRDQALGAKEVMKWSYVDTTRVAVWGWSGGGSSTLNLMFQYPDQYQTGISIAPVTSSLLYDNIYTERYMGLPQENKEDYEKGAALTHAKNLKGNLLFIHGTGDDNVHYQNVEKLINELVKNGKMFQMMSYPNRTHGISEGAGTFDHLGKLYRQYLREKCPPGGRTEEQVRAAGKTQKPF